MHPVRMELAPHARLGRRMSAAAAIFVLLIFHVAIVMVGVLNWNTPCDTRLGVMLIVYGGIGLLFVYLLFREWLYYARLSSLPTVTNLLLLIVFYACLCTAGGLLSYYTVTLRASCASSAPLLYRWAQAAVLFFGIIVFLFLTVPVVRGLARVLLAPLALCMIACVETVGVDIEVGEPVAAAGEGDGGYGAAVAAGAGAGRGGLSGSGSGKGKPLSAAQRGRAAMSALALGCCAPCYLLAAPFAFCMKPLRMCLGMLLAPFGFCGYKMLKACGLLQFDPELGMLTCKNPFAGMSCPGFARDLAQIALAPGCVVPGRSLIALFVNTAALLWFFLYLAFDLYDSWEVVCVSRNPGTSFSADAMGWLRRGAPSPIHWLLLLFSVSGVLVVSLSFLHDIFTGPKPPPRSYYEAAIWRGRRQVAVLGTVLLLVAFLGWGLALMYFTFLGDECSQSDPSLYNVALMLVLLLLVVLFIILFLGCCVFLDCCISGRVRLLLLIGSPNQQSAADRAPPPEQYASANSKDGELDERLIPGVPPRDGYGSRGSQGAGGGFLVGVDAEGAASRLCVDGGRSASWSSPGAKLPPPRR